MTLVESNMDDPKFDPWSAKPPEIPKLPKPLSPSDFELQSKIYLASLESKLERLKSKNREPSSKEMIKNLTAVKDAQMADLVRTSVTSYVSNHEYIEENAEETRLAALQRRLHPERTALNPQELDILVNNDHLTGRTDATASHESDNMREVHSDIYVSLSQSNDNLQASNESSASEKKDGTIMEPHSSDCSHKY